MIPASALVATTRRGGIRLQTNLCVWHATTGDSLRSSLEWVARPDSTSGFHLGLDRDGSVQLSTPLQFVAWHAGQSAWPVPSGGVPDHASVNARSVGIEFANKNDGIEQITPAQIESAVRVVTELAARYPWLKTVAAHVRHRDIAPGRKSDPDPRGFDWPAFQSRLAEAFT